MSVTDDPLARSDQHDPQPPTADSRAGSAERRPGGGWFRAFWRWHFYASFLVIPFLLMLSVTGLIYLLRFQIEPGLHQNLMMVKAPAPAGEVAESYAAQQRAVDAAYPQAVVSSMTEPREPDRSTVFSITTADGSVRDVFVDPWTARVLGDLNPDITLSGAAIRLHGDLMVGPWGDYLIELAACWAVVMAITGYLIFVTGRKARRRRRVAKAKGAPLRNRHAWTGAVAGLGLLLILVTGLPWTGFWGEQVQKLATDRGTSLWGEDPGALSDPASTLDESLPHSHKVNVPWGLGKSEVPTSDTAAAGKKVSVANIDTAIAVGAKAGLKHPMTVALPEDNQGVFSAIGYAFTDPGREKTVHVDQYGGRVVSTYGYDDYPVLAKVVSQGIALHEGRRFGGVTFWAALAFCLAVIFLCVSGPIMWWKRRPRGTGEVGAPRGKLKIKSTWWVALLLVALGIFLPLFGLSLVIVLVLDQLLLRRVELFRRWFAVSA